MRKSWLLIEFKIVDGGNQVHSQAKSSAPISVPLHQNTEDLQFADHVFAYDPAACQSAIGATVSFTQALARRLFLRRLTLGVQLLQALIAAVAQTLGRVSKAGSTALEKFEIVLSTGPVRRADNLLALSIDHKLRLECVPLLLAAVAAPLFF